MKAFACGLVAAGLLVGVMAGCEKPQPEPTTVQTPAEPPRESLPPYPHEQIPAPEPQPSAAVAEEPPVDTSVTEFEEPAPAPKPKRSYAPAARKVARTHTVRSGETLQKISMKYYGTTKNWQKIYRANQKTLKDPDKLQVGMKLVIP